MSSKLKKLFRNPVAVIGKRIRHYIMPLKYKRAKGYKADKYWQDRLRMYSFDLRGVGDISLSHEDNKEMYDDAKKIFLELCAKEQINFDQANILEIGCGTGFYTSIVNEKKANKYLGVDITDTLFPQLKKIYPNYYFEKLDASTQQLTGTFDLIVMIDVTQHITTQEKFSFAMQNIKSHLNDKGVFIITSWLDNKKRASFYEVSRALDSYKKEFPEYNFTSPQKFRDKFIFSISK